MSYIEPERKLKITKRNHKFKQSRRWDLEQVAYFKQETVELHTRYYGPPLETTIYEYDDEVVVICHSEPELIHNSNNIYNTTMPYDLSNVKVGDLLKTRRGVKQEVIAINGLPDAPVITKDDRDVNTYPLSGRYFTNTEEKSPLDIIGPWTEKRKVRLAPALVRHKYLSEYSVTTALYKNLRDAEYSYKDDTTYTVVRLLEEQAIEIEVDG